MTRAASTSPATTDQPGKLWGYLVEFPTARELIAAAEKVRDAGYSRWDCHTPFPVHGLDHAMGIRPTVLPWIVLAAGVTGAAVGLGLQYWTNALEYPFSISGKPLFSLPANIPVMFELAVLFSAFAAFFGMLALNGLPRWCHALLGSRRFRRVTSDRFVISIEAGDPDFDAGRTKSFLESLGGSAVEPVED